MTTSNIKAYPLNRNLLSSIRLNLQHYLWTRALGYILHPTIAQSVFSSSPSASTSTLAAPASASATQNARPPGPNIMDIGTGTGIWLLDLAQLYPTATHATTYIGTDISAAQFPPAILLEPSISFSLLDILSADPDAIPAEWKGTFDVLHIRLFLLVLHNTPPETLLRNCLTLLKSGGYLQWDEADGTSSHVYAPPVHAGSQSQTGTAVPKQQTGEKTKALFDYFRRGGRDGKEWVGDLDDWFARAGFADVIKEEKLFDTNHWQTIEMETSAFGVMGEVVQGMGDGEEARKVKGMMEEAWEECRGGVAFKGSKRISVIGRKP